MEGYLIGAAFLCYSLFQTAFADKIERRRIRKIRRQQRKDMLERERHRKKMASIRSKRMYEQKKLREELWMKHQKNLISLKRTSIFPLPVRIVLYIMNRLMAHIFARRTSKKEA